MAILVLAAALVPVANSPDPRESTTWLDVEETAGIAAPHPRQTAVVVVRNRTSQDQSIQRPGGPEDIREPVAVSAPDDLGDLQESVARVLESALDGDREDVILVADIRRKCSGNFYTLDSVSFLIEHVRERGFSHKKLYSIGRVEHARFETFEAYENFLWQRLAECTAINPLFGEELRQDVYAQAESGLAAARYLYAMWPPAYGPMAYEASLERVDYQERAMAFTRLNMLEREPLGLLALGQSYVGMGYGSGLFTPYDFALGSTLLLASGKCGIAFPWLDDQLDRILRTTQNVNDNRLEMLESASESLRSDYCM